MIVITSRSSRRGGRQRRRGGVAMLRTAQAMEETVHGGSAT